ncbi:MAG: hypothetical protein RR054_06470 [Clostridia bacterium]
MVIALIIASKENVCYEKAFLYMAVNSVHFIMKLVKMYDLFSCKVEGKNI